MPAPWQAGRQLILSEETAKLALDYTRIKTAPLLDGRQLTRQGADETAGVYT
jgi:hypothetical protein